MACLNLPRDIRYKPENMYLAILPGPKEPPLNTLNYYVQHIIDDLEVAWDNGIYITRTPAYRNGHNTRSAVVAVVNDLPAARKTAALAPHQSHFYCSVCNCIHLSTRGCTNYQDWKIRDCNEMRAFAEAWRDAPTSVDQERIFSTHGIRWSEFWRLKYWNPTRQLVVDGMHCLFEGLAHYHNRHILKLTSAEAVATPKLLPAFSHEFTTVPGEIQRKATEIEQVKQIHSLLTAHVVGGERQDAIEESLTALSKKLHTKGLWPLQFVVDDLHIIVPPSEYVVVRNADKTIALNPDGSPQTRPLTRKKDFIAALITWVGGVSPWQSMTNK